MSDLEGKILYSISSELAYIIAKRYYNDKYYAWCTLRFDFGDHQPSSSNPRSICCTYLRDIATKDSHSLLIEKNRDGILTGASTMLKRGVITEEQELEIRKMVDKAALRYFFPAIFIINGSLAHVFCREVDPKKKAASHSVEYIAEDLPHEMFSVILIRDILTDIRFFEGEWLYEGLLNSSSSEI